MTKPGRMLALLLLLLTIVYAPIVFTNFLTSDCAAFFEGRQNHDIFLKIVGDGRPILAFIYEHSINALERPSSVRFLRMFYLLFVLIFALLLFRQKEETRSLHFRFALTFLILTSPGMLEKASLTPSFMTPICGIVALLSSNAMSRAAQAQRRQRALLGVLAFIGVLFIFSLYQPFAMFIVVFVLLELLEKRRSKSDYLSMLTLSALTVSSALVTYYFVVVKWFPQWLNAPQVARDTFTHAPLVKAGWFLAMPLRDALNLFVVFTTDPIVEVGLFNAEALQNGGMASKALTALFHPSYALAFVVGTFVLFCLYRLSRDSFSIATVFILGSLSFPSALALNIVVESYWSPYRTQVALYGVVVVVLLLGIESFETRSKKAFVVYVTVAASAIAALLTAHFYVAKPLRSEWSHALEQARSLKDAKSVRVFPAPLEAYYGPKPRYEMGRAASSAPWGELTLAACAFKESGRAVSIKKAESAAEADMVLGIRKK